jgi:hypothetical protein
MSFRVGNATKTGNSYIFRIRRRVIFFPPAQTTASKCVINQSMHHSHVRNYKLHLVYGIENVPSLICFCSVQFRAEVSEILLFHTGSD